MEDRIYQRAMKMLSLKTSNLDAAREAGDQETARELFQQQQGILSALVYLRIIEQEKWAELNEDLFENHYYL